MYHLILSLSLFFSLNFYSFSQSERKYFELIGTSNVKSGTVRLQPVGDSAYYEYGLSNKLDSIRSGNFILQGSLSSPIAIRLRVFIAEQLVYISDIFFVQSGKNYIDINVDSIGETPRIKNEAMLQYKDIKSKLDQVEIKGEKWAEEISKNQSNETADSINKSRLISIKFSFIDSMKAKTLIEYIIRHSNSYIPLWIIIDEFESGYNPSLLTSFEKLSGEVKRSFSGSTLGSRLEKASALSIGNKFPSINARNLFSNIDEEIHPENAKYTLIDFWFENCSPCLQQFQNIQQFYHKFSRNDFEVIAVSIDPITRRSNLISLIQKKKFTWKQYFNASLFANEYSITSFPRSYLIDNKGMIVMVDVTAVQLLDFLNNSRLNKP